MLEELESLEGYLLPAGRPCRSPRRLGRAAEAAVATERLALTTRAGRRFLERRLAEISPAAS